MLYLLYNILFVLMQSQLGKACTTKNNVFIRLFAYVVLMRLQQSRKRVPPMTTFSALSKTRILWTPSVSYVKGKLCISSVSERHSVPYRKNWTSRTSMPLTQALTCPPNAAAIRAAANDIHAPGIIRSHAKGNCHCTGSLLLCIRRKEISRYQRIRILLPVVGRYGCPCRHCRTSHIESCLSGKDLRLSCP